ncbi:protocadherin alpha-C2-like [Mobula birostris]|uniref:protocadherin alpha-C2-like n=1 Tax=Mobula birostris TaxID=1983395 RepID=UPI003B2861C3
MSFRRRSWKIMATELSHGLSFIHLVCALQLVCGQIRYSIPEELELGAFVGNIAEDLSLSISEITDRKLRLLSDDKLQLLKVNMHNGILVVKERIDRDALCKQMPTCSVSYDAALENPLELHRVDVEIVDINDNAPGFGENKYNIHISEFTATGALFPLDRAQDADMGTNAVISYKINSNEHFGLKEKEVDDRSKITELILQKPLDREQQSEFHVILTAIDGGIPPRSGTAEIIISIVDANDNAPVFERHTYRVSIRENTPTGTIVTKIKAADLDEGANGEVNYSFGTHVSQSVRELFTLDSESGQIYVNGLLDYEVENAYEIEVQAVDKGVPALSGNAKIIVVLTDINDNAPEIRVTSVSSNVREDDALGTVVAIISVTDRDPGENGQVRCRIPNTVPFKLLKSLNNQFKLIVNNAMDRESIPLYNIPITAWDAGLPSLSANKTLIISVSDINDNVPKFAQSSYRVFVMENNAPGGSIFTVTALDPDFDKNGKISYSLVESPIGIASPSGAVSVNSDSGCIYALRSFDYEKLKNFQFKVQASDSGSPAMSSTATVNVVILDQNDNAPVIVSPSKLNNAAATQVVHHSPYPGMIVSKIMATDADSGQNARLYYQLLEATDRTLFTVGLLSGEIRTSRTFQNEDRSKHTLVILVKDNGQPSLSSTVTVVFSFLRNATENFSELTNKPKDQLLFSDLNSILIIVLGSTSCIFLLIIILLVILKCNQDKNIYGYSYRICCHSWVNANDDSNRRAVPKAVLNSASAVQTLPIRESYNYTVTLSPDSSNSDFLFLKPHHPTLPLDEFQRS